MQALFVRCKPLNEWAFQASNSKEYGKGKTIIKTRTLSNEIPVFKIYLITKQGRNTSQLREVREPQ